MTDNQPVWDCRPMAEDEYMEWECPECGWDSQDGDYNDPEVFMGEKDWQNLNNPQLPFNATEWVEMWRCPNCGNKFGVDYCNY